MSSSREHIELSSRTDSDNGGKLDEHRDNVEGIKTNPTKFTREMSKRGYSAITGWLEKLHSL